MRSGRLRRRPPKVRPLAATSSSAFSFQKRSGLELYELGGVETLSLKGGDMIVRRSKLVLSALRSGALEEASKCGADAVVLDTCFTVPGSQQAQAKAALASLAGTSKPPGLEVLAWVGKEEVQEVLSPDLGGLLDGIVATVATAEDVRSLDSLLGTLESQRGLTSGKLELDLVVDTMRGLNDVDDLVNASPRVVSINLDEDALAAEMGLEPSKEEDQLFYARGRIVIIARVAQIQAHGLAFLPGQPTVEERATAARRVALKGAFCWRPEDAEAQNRGFGYNPDEQEYAQGQADAMQEAEKQGLGSVTFRGVMVDMAMYKHARNVLNWSQAVNDKEAAKVALAR